LNDLCSVLMQAIGTITLATCFDAVGWAAGRASGLYKTERWDDGMVVWDEV